MGLGEGQDRSIYVDKREGTVGWGPEQHIPGSALTHSVLVSRSLGRSQVPLAHPPIQSSLAPWTWLSQRLEHSHNTLAGN